MSAPAGHNYFPLSAVEENYGSRILPSRSIIRTPSPTPSEIEALGGAKKKQEFTWKSLINIGILLVVIALVTLLIIYHDRIVDALKPAAAWMKRTPGAWLIPIGILIVLSFPPLIGHEIVLIIVGFTWGLGAGFGIAAAGTFFGELVTFYFFKLVCRGREKELENVLQYVLFTRVLQDGGWVMVTIARYSSVPPHLLTALLSVCGMDVFTFSVAALLSLPRQLVGVYLGYSLISSPDGKTSKTARIVQYTSIGVAIAISYVAMYYIQRKQKDIAPEIVYQRRKRRQARLQAEDATHGIVTPVSHHPHMLHMDV